GPDRAAALPELLAGAATGGAGQAAGTGGVAGADPPAFPVQHAQYRGGAGARAAGRGRAGAAGPGRPVPQRTARTAPHPDRGGAGADPALPRDRAAALRRRSEERRGGEEWRTGWAA